MRQSESVGWHRVKGGRFMGRIGAHPEILAGFFPVAFGVGDNHAEKKETVPCGIVRRAPDASVYAEAFLAEGRAVLDYL